MNLPPRSSAQSRDQVYAALEAERGSAYLLEADLSIAYVNDAWRRFAEDNGAPELATIWASGEPVTRFIQTPLRQLFAARFARSLTRREGWSHLYECSSAEVYRKFHMRVEPAAWGDGLIVVHSLIAEAALDPGSVADQRVRLYTDSRGLIVCCAACGRVREAASPQWDWAPGLIGDDTENVSHGICPTCEFQYYGGETSTAPGT